MPPPIIGAFFHSVAPLSPVVLERYLDYLPYLRTCRYVLPQDQSKHGCLLRHRAITGCQLTLFAAGRQV